MRPTTVISVRGISRARRAGLEADPGFVYVGRAFAGWPSSPWGNPYHKFNSRDPVGRFAGDLVRGLERVHPFRGRGPMVEATTALFVCFDRMAWRLPDLAGKVLGCWCCDWSPGDPPVACHAVVLARLCRAIQRPGEPDFDRVGGAALCPGCGRSYRDHPDSLDTLDYSDRPWLVEACGGRLVKL